MLWILVLMAVVNCAGTLALKNGAATGALFWVGLGMLCYCFGALLYFEIMRRDLPLGLASLITSLSQLLVLVLISQFVLGDAPLSTSQWVGLGLALVALTLCAGPSR
jgi:multidrug transporter EmrE-like cation transporter